MEIHVAEECLQVERKCPFAQFGCNFNVSITLPLTHGECGYVYVCMCIYKLYYNNMHVKRVLWDGCRMQMSIKGFFSKSRIIDSFLLFSLGTWSQGVGARERKPFLSHENGVKSCRQQLTTSHTGNQ